MIKFVLYINCFIFLFSSPNSIMAKPIGMPMAPVTMNRTSMRATAILMLRFPFPTRPHQAVDADRRIDDQQHHEDAEGTEYHGHGKPERGRLLPRREGDVVIIAVERHNKDDQDQPGADQGKRSARLRPDALVDEIERDVLPFLDDRGRADANDPDIEDAGNLLGPRQRVVQHVAEENLHGEGDDQGREAKDAENLGQLGHQRPERFDHPATPEPAPRPSRPWRASGIVANRSA